MEKAIKRAIEGGWRDDLVQAHADLHCDGNSECVSKDFYNCDVIDNNRKNFLLDPLFWQALGRAEGWEDNGYEKPDWIYNWHQFIDHIAEGKDIDSYFNNLMK